MSYFFGNILNCILVLIAWSCIALILLYVYRIPAFSKAKLNPQKFAIQNEDYHRAVSKLPPEVTQVGENYKHLMEQPTIYYALLLYIYLYEEGKYRMDSTLLILAWSYVVLRIVHSLLQMFYNVVLIRFSVFVVSSLVLFGMVVKLLMSEVLRAF